MEKEIIAKFKAEGLNAYTYTSENAGEILQKCVGANKLIHHWALREREIIDQLDKPKITLSQIKQLPTVTQGHAKDLKLENLLFQVWVSRMTKEDGMPYDNQITVKRLNTTTWEWDTIQQYKPKK